MGERSRIAHVTGATFKRPAPSYGLHQSIKKRPVWRRTRQAVKTLMARGAVNAMLYVIGCLTDIEVDESFSYAEDIVSKNQCLSSMIINSI